MNKSYSIGDLMALYYERKFAAIEETVITDFSDKHIRKMKKAFAIFNRNKALPANKCPTAKTKRPLSVRERRV